MPEFGVVVVALFSFNGKVIWVKLFIYAFISVMKRLEKILVVNSAAFKGLKVNKKANYRYISKVAKKKRKKFQFELSFYFCLDLFLGYMNLKCAEPQMPMTQAVIFYHFY